MMAIDTEPEQIVRSSGRLFARTERSPFPPWKKLWRRGGVRLFGGGTVALMLIVLAVVGPTIAPYEPTKTNFSEILQSPSGTHWLGTDPVGRDELSRILAGTRLAVEIGVVAVVTSMLIGLTLGLLSGYFGRWVDGLITIIVDSLLAVPLLIIALAIVAAFGRTLPNIMLAIGIASAPSVVRLVRSLVLSARSSAYVEAARSIGAADTRIMFRHILPNVMGPPLVLATYRIGTAILAEANLSFLGLGIPPPEPSWGSMANFGRDYIVSAPWLVFAPVGAIFVTVLAWNLLGDGIRDVMDSRIDH